MFELLTSSSMLRFTGYGQKYHVLGCICYKMIISYPRLTRLNHALVQMNFWHDDDVITTFMVHWLWFKNMFWVVNTINPIISHPICIRLDRINHTLVDMKSWHNDNITITFTVNWFSYTFHNSGGKLSWILTKLVFRNVYRSLVTAQCYFSRFSEYHHFSWVICLKSHYLVITSPFTMLTALNFYIKYYFNDKHT